MVVCLVLHLSMSSVKSLESSHALHKYAMWRKQCVFWKVLYSPYARIFQREAGTALWRICRQTNTLFKIKLDSVSCTHYFMSIHNLRYRVQLIKIATRNKKNFEKIPRFLRFKQLCARHSYVCRHGLYVVYIVTQTPSFLRSRELDKSNKFR